MREPTPSLRQRTSGAVRASRAAALLRERARDLAIALIAAGFLATSGAFGSEEAPYLQRLAYWLVLMVSGALVAGTIARYFRTRGWLETREWLQALVVAVLITLVLTPWVWAFTSLFFGGVPRLAVLPYFLPPTLAVSTVMTAVTYMANRRPPETHAAAAGAAPPRFLERLPFKLKGAEIYAVEAEDHYLRLHTSRGSDLLLVRLSDAIAELEGVEGAQTHRSWWVAKDAVTSASRADGRATLTLKDGTVAPVSRTFAKALRDGGWF